MLVHMSHAFWNSEGVYGSARSTFLHGPLETSEIKCDIAWNWNMFLNTFIFLVKKVLTMLLLRLEEKILDLTIYLEHDKNPIWIHLHLQFDDYFSLCPCLVLGLWTSS